MDMTILYLLIGCFGLGMLHGVIPDEHTWPITFSYSVGSATGKGGMKAASFFSIAFTIQRAMMSQIIYFAVAMFLVSSDKLNAPVYVVVGLAMTIAGYLILKNRVPHVHPFLGVSQKDLAKHMHESDDTDHMPVPLHWAMIHGFISGFGVDTGILSTFVYLVTLPAIAKAGIWEIGWLPGALFGVGTFAVLMVIGLVFGGALQIGQKYGADRMRVFGRLVGARVLFLGGMIFIAFGPAYYFGLSNMVPFDFGTFIVLVVMIVVAVPIMVFTWKEVVKKPAASADTSLV